MVVLLDAIAAAGKPCPVIRIEVGAAPMKLKVVPADPELANTTHGLTVYVVDADRSDVAPVAVIVFVPEFWSATTRESPKLHDPTVFVMHDVVPNDAVVKAVVATVTVSAAPKPVMVKVLVPKSVCSGNP
jgi:hypothetical protein